MTKYLIAAAVAAVTVLSPTIPQAGKEPAAKDKDGWKTLLDGKSLDGWKKTSFGGEGEVSVKDGTVVMERGNDMTGITEWYRVRIVVTKDKIEAWIDKDKMVDLNVKGKKITIRGECEASKPFGIATWRTEGAVRDVRVRALKK